MLYLCGPMLCRFLSPSKMFDLDNDYIETSLFLKIFESEIVTLSGLINNKILILFEASLKLSAH